MIVSFGILNKASGFYGLASLLTGHPISAMEWVLNLWSLAFLSLFVIAYIAMRQRQALTILLFAHFYVVDTLFSIAFTIFFCVKWFKNQKKTSLLHEATSAIYSVAARGGNFSDSEASVAGEVADAISSVKESIKTVAENNAMFSDSASLGQESAVSILFTVLLLLTRIYFTLVIIAYARQLVCQQNLRRYNGTPRGSWAYTLQSILLGPFESFWTGFTSSSSSFSPLTSSSHFGEESDRTPLSDTKFEVDGN